METRHRCIARPGPLHMHEHSYVSSQGRAQGRVTLGQPCRRHDKTGRRRASQCRSAKAGINDAKTNTRWGRERHSGWGLDFFGRRTRVWRRERHSGWGLNFFRTNTRWGRERHCGFLRKDEYAFGEKDTPVDVWISFGSGDFGECRHVGCVFHFSCFLFAVCLYFLRFMTNVVVYADTVRLHQGSVARCSVGNESCQRPKQKWKYSTPSHPSHAPAPHHGPAARISISIHRMPHDGPVAHHGPALRI